MSKELPFFKFSPTEWLIGKISFQPLEVQGAFIHCVCKYWKKFGEMKVDDVEYIIGESMLDILVDKGFVKRDGENLSIDFLEEQLQDFEGIREKRRIAGAKGGQAKYKLKKANAKQVLANAKQNLADKDKDKDKEEKEKVLDFVSLTRSEIVKLKEEFGDDGFNWMVEKLNNYKGAEGKKYKSDYLAIRNWVVASYEESKNKRLGRFIVMRNGASDQSTNTNLFQQAIQ